MKIKSCAADRRSGAVVVESAIVLPVALIVLLAIVSGALAVFTYQQVASLAREGARAASVHGYEYSQSTASTAWTASDVYNNAISPKIVNLDTTQLTYGVVWSPNNRQGSFVSVTLTYQMSVPIYGNLTFSSTATQVVTW
jgi:Flp pilus assembly protein TadG